MSTVLNNPLFINALVRKVFTSVERFDPARVGIVHLPRFFLLEYLPALGAYSLAVGLPFLPLHDCHIDMLRE